MRIEVLYVPGCPNYRPTVERVQSVLKSASLPYTVSGVPVNTDAEAQALFFPGSPTVRVNGNDVQPVSIEAPGLACRLYAGIGGIPSEEVLRAAILDAVKKE